MLYIVSLVSLVCQICIPTEVVNLASCAGKTYIIIIYSLIIHDLGNVYLNIDEF